MSDEWNDWDKIAEKFDTAISQVVRKSAFDVQAGYQTRCHVKTGFMKNSAYVVTSKESTYSSVQQPQKGQVLLPEIDKAEDDHTAYVAIGANYGEIEEFGGVHHTAHPALMPALDAVKPSFEAALGKIDDKLREIRG